jgi:hypothetical protein
MNSSAATLQAQPLTLRKLCRVKRCAELRPLGRLLCDHHETMVPEKLAQRIAFANKRFTAAAIDGDIGRAMRALQDGLNTERQICAAIERQEASDA